VTAQEQLRNEVAIVWTAPEKRRGEREKKEIVGAPPHSRIVICVGIEKRHSISTNQLHEHFSFFLSSWEMSHPTDVSNTNRFSFSTAEMTVVVIIIINISLSPSLSH
jgi:hypothetical protein